MRIKDLNVNDTKNKILDDEVKKMLEADNPLQGIYGMYGDHPNNEDILYSIKKSKSKSKISKLSK